jgi:hypothetical protein
VQTPGVAVGVADLDVEVELAAIERKPPCPSIAGNTMSMWLTPSSPACA